MIYNNFDIKREKMVAFLASSGVHDRAVLGAMSKVPRHLFVPGSIQEYAYMDSALGIECNQTISQPYIVAFMTEVAELGSNSKVLEIGTGSGYQTAILAEICKKVYTVEIIEQLAENAADLLNSLGYSNIESKIADGHEGWAEKAPFDVIIVTAAAGTLPKILLEQLIINGHIIMPLQEDLTNRQALVKVTKTSAGNDYIMENLLNVSFVPMVRH